MMIGTSKSFFRAVSGERSLRLAVRRAVMFLALCSAGIGAAAAVGGDAYAETVQQKVIQGKVFDDGSVPQPGAIIYLRSVKANSIKSYIAAPDGGYRFGQLATDTDYMLWAELHGKKSAVKTVTAYDNKRQFFIDLHLTGTAK